LNEIGERLVRIEEKIIGIAKVNKVEHKNINDKLDDLIKHVNEEILDHQKRIRKVEEQSTKYGLVYSLLVFLGGVVITSGIVIYCKIVFGL